MNGLFSSNNRAARMDHGSGDVRFLLRDSEIYSLSLGLPNDHSLALTPTELGLPDPDVFIQETRDLGLPEMLSFVTACLGVMLAVYLIKSWKQ